MNQQEKIAIYTPESALANPSRMIQAMFIDLASSGDLAIRLARRDIKAQYRQAFLGLIWAFILPVAHAATWIFLSSSNIVRVADSGSQYYLYAFSGTVLWAVFMDSMNAPLQQVINSKSILTKLNFPKEALIVSGIIQTVFNAGIKVALLLIVLVASGTTIGWSFLLFPFGVASIILFGTTLGLLVTPIGVLYTDVGKALPLLTQFLMYLSPVVFVLPDKGIARDLFLLNPLTPMISTTRSWLLNQGTPLLGYFLGVCVAACALLLLVWALYRLAMPILVERMGS